MLVGSYPKHPNWLAESRCHEICQDAENENIGVRISGWRVICEVLGKEFPVGFCRLIHHSNFLAKDGHFFNCVNDFGRAYHIFIPDDDRHYDLAAKVGYNDRVYFINDYIGGEHSFPEHKPELNTVYFARQSNIDKHPDAEKYTTFHSAEDLMKSVPKSGRTEWLERHINMNCKLIIHSDSSG
jgi:hypothetical protein